MPLETGGRMKIGGSDCAAEIYVSRWHSRATFCRKWRKNRRRAFWYIKEGGARGWERKKSNAWCRKIFLYTVRRTDGQRIGMNAARITCEPCASLSIQFPRLRVGLIRSELHARYTFSSWSLINLLPREIYIIVSLTQLRPPSIIIAYVRGKRDYTCTSNPPCSLSSSRLAFSRFFWAAELSRENTVIRRGTDGGDA